MKMTRHRRRHMTMTGRPPLSQRVGWEDGQESEGLYDGLYPEI